jgi:hypothetical protein
VNFQNPGGVPCSDSTITTDGGSQVLLVQQDKVGTPLSFLYPGHWVQPGVFFPNETYIEMTFRTTSQSLVQNGSGPFGSIDWFWESLRGETPPPPSWVEIDFLEIVNTPHSSPNWGGGLLDWQPNPNYGPVTYGTTDLTQYHTLGVLVTSDESSNIYKCTFMDGSFIGCINQAQGEPRNYVQHNNAVTVWLGWPGTNYTSPVQVYIKSIKIWECANYQTTGCPGTMVTHWPFP